MEYASRAYALRDHATEREKLIISGLYFRATGDIGVKAGAHIFRRFRNSHLRASNVPAGLLKYWMGHSRKQDMSDVYDKSAEDAAWRTEIAEQIGTGFTVPNCTDCTEKEKEATGAVASK